MPREVIHGLRKGIVFLYIDDGFFFFFAWACVGSPDLPLSGFSSTGRLVLFLLMPAYDMTR